MTLYKSTYLRNISRVFSVTIVMVGIVVSADIRLEILIEII